MLKAVTLSPFTRVSPYHHHHPPPPPYRRVAHTRRPPTLTHFQAKQTTGSFYPKQLKPRPRWFLDCHRINTNTFRNKAQRHGRTWPSWPESARSIWLSADYSPWTGRAALHVLIRLPGDVTKLETPPSNIQFHGIVFLSAESWWLDSTEAHCREKKIRAQYHVI